MVTTRAFLCGYLYPSFLPMACLFFLFMKHFFSLMRGGPVTGLLLILLVLMGPAAQAQAPAWQMAIAAGSGSITEAYGTAADASGNVYIGGSFQGTVSFGSTVLTGAGGYDLFVAKYNPVSGGFEWAVRTGGNGYDEVRAVAVNSTGIYIAGFTQSALINFGPSTLGTTSGSDGFVAKLTPTGSFVWAEQVSGDGNDEILALAVNGPNVYIGGSFTSNTVAFGPRTLTNTGTVNAGYTDGFIAKLTDAGTSAGFAWAQKLGGSNNDLVTALAVAGADVVVAGSFRLNAAFGSLTAASAGLQDVFVAKLRDSGSTSQFAWVQRAGGAVGDDVAQALAVSGTRVYVAGYFDSPTAAFGPATVARAGGYDAFVAQLTDAGTSGSFGWAQRMGGTNNDRAHGLVATAAGVAVAGYFDSAPATFGPLTLANYGGNGSSDIFVTRLADSGTAGTFVWAQRAGGVRDDQGFALALSGPTLYVAGNVSPQAIFAPLTINTPVTVRIPLLASLTDATLTATTASQGNLTFTLAPNPARTSTTVMLPAQPGTASATLTLLDALSRAVRTAVVALPPAGLRHELDLIGLSPGLYALRVMAGTSSATSRLAVE